MSIVSLSFFIRSGVRLIRTNGVVVMSAASRLIVSARRLKRAVVFAILVSLTLAAHASEDAHLPYSEFQSGAFGKTYVATISPDAIKAAPVWNDEDNPPISARVALKLAGKCASELVGRPKGYQRYLDGLTLRHVDGGWVWYVKFDWLPTVGGFSGIPDHLIIVVLMNGEVVCPKVRGKRSASN